ncbi:hypothetical protein O7630_11605 [Micromonospora sp. WMMD718]|uniref:hypothetical protein n=1 Tax=Micromonospora sp. WMMD718 TaxID=3016098 RepID=UPI00241695C6|nr:hypothetical protein [Micromonospora sp. WMMD718]MDG4751588.1 hypothetical protein [Micromonospora sp. WMMD718]
MTPRETEPAGWRLARELARSLWRELRAGPQPLPVLYLACDGCGQVTAHTRVQKVMSISDGTLTSSPPEAVCEACEHAQPARSATSCPPTPRSSAPVTGSGGSDSGADARCAAKPLPSRSLRC